MCFAREELSLSLGCPVPPAFAVGTQRTLVFPQASAATFGFLGGCGAMYEIHIESEDFKEKRTVQQHQMVNQVRGGSVCV